MGANRRAFFRRFSVIAGLSTLAVAWPLLDMFGRNPEVFVANRTSPGQMIAFALVVTLAVPLLMMAVLWTLELFRPNAGNHAFIGAVGLLALATGLVVARQLSDSPVAVVAIALGVVGLVWGVRRWADGVLSWSALALPLAPVLFLFASPSAGLIWDREPVEVSGQIGSPAPIVFVQMDEFPLASIVTPEGKINEALFPNFARLAGEGTWYRNAFSDSIATTQSIPSILTGRRFERGLAQSYEAHPTNLFTLLGAEYRMHVIEWVASMCPVEICPDYAGRAPARFVSLLTDAVVVYGHLAAPPGTERLLPSIDNSWRGFLGQGAAPEGEPIEVEGLPVPDPVMRAEWVDWFQRIANGIARTDPPILSYLHVQAPHVPWVANPTGTHYERPEQYSEVDGVGGDGRWHGNQGLGVIGFQRHLYQLGLVDRMLGRVFAEMDRTRVWDRSLVVVVADHGTSFELGEHRRWPFDKNIDDLYRIPLFIKYPGQGQGEVVDAPAFGIDILPTIIDVLDASVDWSMDGTSLLDVEGTNRPHQPMWWCCSRDAASTDLSVLFDQVQRNRRWIPDQESWLGVAGAHAATGMVGTEVDVLPVGRDDRVAWHLELGAALLLDHRPEGVIQTYLNGRITHPPELAVDEVLFAVNGVVAGAGVVVAEGPGSGTFQGMIAEQLVNRGPNQVDVMVPGPDGTWLSGAAADLTLDLVTGDGRLLDVRPEGARRVQVDQVRRSGEGALTLVGWAADVAAGVPPEWIHVFAGDRWLITVAPNLDNGNVVAWFGSEELLRSGFRVVIRASDLPEGAAQVTVVAEFDSYAVAESVPVPPG
jgi:hypothetical protein